MGIYQFAPLEAMPAQTLRARNHCCRNRCIHCPYGFTLKTFGLNFVKITERYLDVAHKISAGQMDLEKYSVDDYRIVTLKGFYIAVIRVDHLFVREYYLLPDFSDQGLTKEVVESYFFC